MKILFLGYIDSPLIAFLEDDGNEVITTDKKIDYAGVKNISPDFIISYGYRYIISKEIVEQWKDRAINLHISYLPWNRGADPNLWSFVEDTPKGVTIHYIDYGLDTGDIIVQKEVSFSDEDTLKTSYDKLHQEIQTLFKEHWRNIRTGKNQRYKQTGKGSYHKAKDKEPLLYLLSKGYDTPISALKDIMVNQKITTAKEKPL
jgi:methionyl-tRNA formyltransferase